MLRIILMAAPLALAAFGVFMLCRNEWVFRERRRLLNTMPISEGLRLHRSLPDYDCHDAAFLDLGRAEVHAAMSHLLNGPRNHQTMTGKREGPDMTLVRTALAERWFR